jgi:pimeloyl-ACP methyl ester carboxylesterase
MVTKHAASLVLAANLHHANAAGQCTSEAIAKPSVFGAEVINFTASAINDFYGITSNNVCSVNITITHPGTGDNVNNYILLPLTGWNGVFQGIGGGGYTPGSIPSSAAQSMLGYSTGTTDAGITIDSSLSGDASPWALLSPGNVNQNLALNFAHRSYHDMTVIGKQISESFYGAAPKHAYWNGCSTGGRQALAMAQYYPSDYDGILADAPAIQWNDFTPAQQWPYTVENNEGYAPSPCEFDAVVAATVEACDALDGLVDGTISAPGLCKFSAQSLVGKTYTCDTDGSTQTFRQKSADVIDKIYHGARTPQNQFLWYGLIAGANFSNTAPNIAGNSTPQPFDISDSWYRGFIAKNLTFDTANISYAEFAGEYHKALPHPAHADKHQTLSYKATSNTTPSSAPPAPISPPSSAAVEK